MATVNEKLAQLRRQALPALEELLAAQTLGLRMAATAARPSLDRALDELLARPADDLDAGLAVVIAFLAAHRSDNAECVLGWSGGAHYARVTSLRNEAGELVRCWVAGDPVQRPGAAGGPDEVREVDGGEGPVPVGGRAAAGDRPG